MNVGRLGLLALLLVTPAAAQECVGDCNCDRAVTVDEITGLTMVALNGGWACDCGACPSGGIAVPCIVTAIDNAMQGCRPPACVGDCDTGEAGARDLNAE